MPTGAPASHRLDASRIADPGRNRPRRTRDASQRRRYLWCGLLLVPALIVGGLYLTRGPAGPARTLGASQSGPGAATTSTAAASAAPRSLATASAAAGPAAAGSPGTAPSAGTAPGLAACGQACAVTPFNVSLARVPARARRSGARTSASPSALAPDATPHASAVSSPSASARPSSPAAQQPGGQQGIPADQVLALINQARASAGLPPLTFTSGLDDSASAHNLKMAQGCGLTHQCPGEPAIGDRETAAGVSWTAAGENIGEGGPVSDTTAAMAQMAVTLTQDMLNEQPPDNGHRLNILSTTFTHIGIAVYRDSPGTVWMTQDFSN